MNKYMAVRNSILVKIGDEWLHYEECNSFEEAKKKAKKLNER
jgi:hypothetical protein